MIGLKDSRQFFNQWDAKPKPIAPCTRDISRASGELQVIARNCDWFMELFVPVVIGRSNCFGNLLLYQWIVLSTLWTTGACIIRLRTIYVSGTRSQVFCPLLVVFTNNVIVFCFFNSHVEDTTNVIVLSYSSEYQHFKYLYKYLLINLAESYDSTLSLYQKNTIAPLFAHLK